MWASGSRAWMWSVWPMGYYTYLLWTHITFSLVPAPSTRRLVEAQPIARCLLQLQSFYRMLKTAETWIALHSYTG